MFHTVIPMPALLAESIFINTCYIDTPAAGIAG